MLIDEQAAVISQVLLPARAARFSIMHTPDHSRLAQIKIYTPRCSGVNPLASPTIPLVMFNKTTIFVTQAKLFIFLFSETASRAHTHTDTHLRLVGVPSVEDIALIRDWSLQGVSPFNDHATNQRSFSVSLSFFPPFSFLFTGTAANPATLQTKHLFHHTPTLFIYVIAIAKYCKNFEAFRDMPGGNVRLLLLQFHKKHVSFCVFPLLHSPSLPLLLRPIWVAGWMGSESLHLSLNGCTGART